MSVNNQFLNARNVLISKDDVGRGKPAPYQLPGPDFAYGKQDSKDRYGVKEGASIAITPLLILNFTWCSTA